ncbi:hypothetical protein [Nocardioides sp. MH1]|uniref:hypothetical protein n=1 Tax=Nocardioides sp. MH1 TaxID=3242490 RepID=UPI00352281D4
MRTRRSTQHLLAAALTASALALTACGGTDPVTRTDVIDPVVQQDPTTPGSTPADTPADTPAGGPLTTVPIDFPIDAAADGEEPTSDGEVTVHGPARDEDGVGSLSLCGQDVVLPGQGDHAPDEALGYAVTGPEYYIGRSIQSFPTITAAVDRIAGLRTQVEACSTDTDDLGNTRQWRVFDADTGHDSLTFGYTYGPDSAPAGELFSVVRAGTALLALRFYAEYSPDSLERYGVPGSVDTVDLLAPEMCVFTAAGCGDGSGTTTIPDDVPLDDRLADMTGDGGAYAAAYHPDRTPH